MTYRHFLGANALFLIVFTTGCGNQRAQSEAAEEQPQRLERHSQLAQNDTATEEAGEGRTEIELGVANTEQILAHKTASYAEEIERLLAERSREAAAAKAAAAAATPDLAVTVAPTAKPTANAGAAIAPAPAKSEVVFADPGQLPPAQPAPQNPIVAQAVAAGATEQKPTVHQLLDMGPATANQAQHIPAAGAQVAAAAVVPAPTIDSRPEAVQPPRQQVSELLDSSDALARKLSERLKADPLDVSAHLDYQLLQMLNDQSVPALDAIASLPQEDREIVSALLDGLSNFRHGIRTGGNALLGQKIGPIVEMGERVRNQTTLAIPSLVLCRDVKQFGIYQPLESTRFPFGQKHPVVVYCEVANFASQLNSRNLWETRLKYEVLLYTENASLQVWQQKPTPVVDQSNSRRRDFFIAKLMELPQDLPIGGYLMKVSIIDETANRIAEATVPLQIVAK
ncbi:MAG TPA: hypothetical protein VGR35_20060 [Tepidisphaeraceae bacterium]|nr:hypothetical protein [Tepidisphaeraceae bacterium]